MGKAIVCLSMAFAIPAASVLIHDSYGLPEPVLFALGAAAGALATFGYVEARQ